MIASACKRPVDSSLNFEIPTQILGFAPIFLKTLPNFDNGKKNPPQNRNPSSNIDDFIYYFIYLVLFCT